MIMTGQHQGRNTLPPISEDCLIEYVSHCHGFRHLRYATIKLYLCGIRFTYLQHGLSNPLTQPDGQPLFRLFTILRGVKRSQVPVTKPRLPITFSVLYKLCVLFRAGFFGAYTDLLMETVCIFAFFGFLRCGEFTTRTKIFDPVVHLCVSDLFVYSDSILLKLKSSKTDPFRAGTDIHFYCTFREICPVVSLKRYLLIRSAIQSPDSPSPLFVTANNHVLTRTVFLDHLKTALSAIHCDSNLYNGHSFRIGAATTASTVRMEDHLIRTLGRWSSDCYTRYIRTIPSVVQAAQQSLCTLLP